MATYAVFEFNGSRSFLLLVSERTVVTSGMLLNTRNHKATLTAVFLAVAQTLSHPAVAEEADVRSAAAQPALIDPDLARMGGDLALGVKTPFDTTYLYCGVYTVPQDDSDTLVAYFRTVEHHKFNGILSTNSYGLPLNTRSLQKAVKLGLHIQAADALADVRTTYEHLLKEPAAPRPAMLYNAKCGPQALNGQSPVVNALG